MCVFFFWLLFWDGFCRFFGGVLGCWFGFGDFQRLLSVLFSVGGEGFRKLIGGVRYPRKITRSLPENL